MRRAGFGTIILFLSLGRFLAGCGESKGDPKAEAPPPAKVEQEGDANLIQVVHPEQFPLATAVAHESRSQLTVTGTVNPDISRSVPVISSSPFFVLLTRTKRLSDEAPYQCLVDDHPSF